MQVRINGASAEIESNLTIEGLLNNLNIDPQRVAVEINLNIVKKKDYPQRLLKEGDNIEIVHFVGGGTDDRGR